LDSFTTSSDIDIRDTKESIRGLIDIGRNEIVEGQVEPLGMRGKSLSFAVNAGSEISVLLSEEQRTRYEGIGANLSKPTIVSHFASESTKRASSLGIATLDPSLYDTPVSSQFKSKPLLFSVNSLMSECSDNNNTYTASVLLNHYSPLDKTN
jgi:hypothetical protein